ncbi:Fur family transcriptional regulator [Tepidamorphus sp. 3E244]|uniref:Fur family transcriptional regulator n=1 Tax=Tepidamorphus sp. 3E244 TaxID=3385498 RepID=UPI0038FD05DC
MGKHTHDTTDLTRNQSLVYGALEGSDGPLSAYAILDELREEGLRAPLQVYRALERLLELGLVHRLESLNAFVACSHPACEEDGTVAFAICETCGKVFEFTDIELKSRIGAWAKSNAFRPRKTAIEIRGLCAECA